MIFWSRKIPVIDALPQKGVVMWSFNVCFGVNQNDQFGKQSLVIWDATNLLWHQWWRHQMETFSALLATCAGNSPVPGEFPTQRPVTRSFDVYFDLRPNKRLSKQSWGWWFETPSRHRNVNVMAPFQWTHTARLAMYCCGEIITFGRVMCNAHWLR